MPLNLNNCVAFLKGRRRKQKHEVVEQATSAPGEVRLIKPKTPKK